MNSIYSNHYVFSKYPYENRRLVHQGELLRKLSCDFVSRVGLEPGLRVIDLGCGTGEFTFLAAEIVGQSGKVVGIDRSVSAIGEAKIRAKDVGYHNVSFIVGDIEAVQLSGDYDVVMGRFILSYLDNPEFTLRKVCNQLRGISYLVFQEWQLDSPPPMKPVSENMLTYHKTILETLRRAGVDMNMGQKLSGLLNKLSAYDVYLTDRHEYEGDMNDDALLEYLTETGIALLNPMIEFGILKSKEEFERLKNSAFKEIKQCHTTLSLNPIVGVASKVNGYSPLPNYGSKRD